MDYKQKYEEALERAKRYQGMVVLPAESMIETIFPELRESEEEKIRKALIELFKVENFNRYITLNGIDVDDVIAWLEKQGQKPAWSEEDEGFLNLLFAIFTNEHPNGVFTTDNITVFKGNCVTSNRIVTWLKSLKDRVQPQNTWKPSDDQMYSLKQAIDSYTFEPDYLEELYEDLKELKGE